MDFSAAEDPGRSNRLTTLEELPPDWRELVRRQVAMIARVLGPQSRIFEVGCGEGILLAELRAMGYSRLQGVEPSRTGALRAQSRGLSVDCAFLEDVRHDEPFDLVIAAHVLEHFDDLSSTIDRMRSALRRGGRIQLTQTHYAAPVPRILGASWYGWTPAQHYWHFTPSGLKALLARHGFGTFSMTYCSLVHPWTWPYRIARKLPLPQDQFILMAEPA